LKPQPKAALVTGCSRGIGRALAEYLLAEQWTVFALVRNPKSLSELKALYPQSLLVLKGDIESDTVSVAIHRELRRSKIKHLDLVVNNAGQPGRGVELMNVNPADVLASFNLHCVGPVRVVKASLDWLLKSKRPVVLNISSRLGSIKHVQNGKYDNYPNSYAYRIAKASQNMLTACLHQEFKSKGLQVFGIHPGLVATDNPPPVPELSSKECAERIFKFYLKPHGQSGMVFEPPKKRIPW
jgi:NAD(P)-dependent dehydrogenase (short-subunit alcohol dehydrogenase family)